MISTLGKITSQVQGSLTTEEQFFLFIGKRTALHKDMWRISELVFKKSLP
jgi:hypothetical protein